MDLKVKAYWKDIPDERKERLVQLHEIIMGLYPAAEVSMKYKMPTYQVGDGWVAIANQKHYISVYTCGAHHLELFKEKHPEIKTGKGCINLKPSDPLPIEDLQQVIRHAMENNKDF